MYEIKLTVDSNVVDLKKFSKMNFDVPLRNVAMAIQTDVKKNLRQSSTYRGPRMKRLADKTMKDKVKLGVATTKMPLMRFRNMFRNIRVKKIGYNFWAVDFSTTTSNAKAYYHNIAGAGATSIIRQFFGVSKKRERWAIKYFETWVANKLKAGKGRQYGTRVY